MMAFLAFTFAGFWHFAGVLLLLLTVGEIAVAVVGALVGSVAALRRPKRDEVRG